MRRLATALALACALLGVAAASASAEVRTFTLRSKPIHVARYQVVRGGDHVPTPRIDGAITYFETHVVDDRGQPIPQWQVMLHHVVFKDVGHGRDVRLDGACPGKGTAGNERFYGTSEEVRPLTLPDGYGYPVERQDRWEMGWMLMNHTKDARVARIQYTVRVDTDKGVRPVKPYWLGVRPCGVDPQFSVPGGASDGAVYDRARSWRMPANGRIVAVGGHLHGGAYDITLRQPRCANRTLTTSQPMYAPPDDPLYQVYPPLHEPDPKEISWWQSATGIPVQKGETLRVTARYRDDYPYMRVMGIDHVYIAHGGPKPSGCAPLPADAQVLGPSFAGRTDPPHTQLTLAALGQDGAAHPIDAPPGATRSFKRDASIVEAGTRFSVANLSVSAGATVRWDFRDRDLHDATLVTGPRGFSSPPMRGGRFTHRFTVPGTYRIYCSVHPVKMMQVLTVRATSQR